MAEVTSPARKKRRSSTNAEEEDEGFKFTRHSRRATTFHKGPQKSALKSAKKKRRSSFVNGRRERRSLPAPSSKINLHQNIPVGLPPNTRLRMLFNASLELAISKITDQPNTIRSDYPDFQQEAKSVFAHLRSIISETDLIDKASQLSQQDMEDRITNKQLEESALNCKMASERFKAEDSKWKELLDSSEQQKQTTEKELQEYSDVSKNKDECPDFLSPIQHKLLSGKPTLKTVLDKLDNMKQTCELQVDSICETVSSLKRFEDVAESYLQNQMEDFGAKSVQVIDDMGTPRTLIRGQLKN